MRKGALQFSVGVGVGGRPGGKGDIHATPQLRGKEPCGCVGEEHSRQRDHGSIVCAGRAVLRTARS